MATLTLMGLYNADEHIFDNMRESIPEEVNADDLINNILLETAELEILYSTSSFMKIALGIWSKKEAPVWRDMYKSTVQEYNPIHNYDRYETYTDTRTPDITRASTGESEGTGTQKSTQAYTGSDNAEHGVWAYNETEEFEPADSNKNDTSSTTINNGELTNKLQSTVQEKETGTETTEHTAHLYGNIGVTTTTQMLQEYRESVQFTVIDFITQSFKKRFCLCVY